MTASLRGRRNRHAAAVNFAAGATLFVIGGRAPAEEPPPAAPTSSLLAQTTSETALPADEEFHALRSISLFAIASTKPRTYKKHDLIQIVVRETSLAKSTHELETDKETKLKGAIGAWPDIQLQELRQLIVRAGRTEDLPKLDISFSKEFSGDGEYKRRDDFTARLTAEVIEVLPNGTLVLEARSRIKMDEEESVLKLTGICRPEDVTAANTILSNQIHDLRIEKINRGELKKSNEKGIITKVLEALFAF